MYECMRYRQPDIRQHLASQYVLGTQSPLVRRRTERLIKDDPELEAEVWFWQSKLAQVHNAIEPQEPPASAWKNISAQLDGSASNKPVRLGLFQGLLQGGLQGLLQRLSIWHATTAVLAVLLTMQLLVQQPDPLPIPAVGADYVALMDSDDADTEPELIVAAYLSKDPGSPSRLEFEWNDRTPQTSINGMTLFAVDRDTGAITNLGQITDSSRSMLLSKPQWKALKNSSDLIISTGSDVNQNPIFRGPCIQIARTG